MLHKLAEAATAGVEKTRIRASELKLGMYVSELDRPWINSPFLIHGFTIRKQTQLTEIQSLCQFVYIDITRGSASSDKNHGAKPSQTQTYSSSQPFNENLEAAITIHGKAKIVIDNMFNAVRSGGLFHIDQVRQSVEDCVNNIIVNPHSMLWLSMIKNKDEYTSEHSLNVAILSIALGRAEGLVQSDLEDLGICAMLHDVGKTKIPSEILNREGSLDEQEFEVMKMHTIHGKKLLIGQPNIPAAAVDIALSHHERMDGSGYPVGLNANQIPYLVRIVAIADAYDAMTSGRVYCEAKPAAEALKLLLDAKDSHFDALLINKFIESIGVYPIGSIAELNSGEAGIVLPTDTNNGLRPLVLVMRDADKSYCEARIVDTNSEKQADNGRPYMIRALHPDGTYGLKLQEFRNINENKDYKSVS